jgi:Tetratricopeptide repeat
LFVPGWCSEREGPKVLPLLFLCVRTARRGSRGRSSRDADEEPSGSVTETTQPAIAQTLGGVVAQFQTDNRGTFEISSIRQSVYTVTAHQPGYQDDSQRVELTTVPTAYVELTLVPLAGKSLLAGGPAASRPTVSAAELALPEATRQEFEKARELIDKEHNPKKAIPHLREVVKKAPSFAEAYLLLGTAQMDSHHWKDAQTALEQAVSLDHKAGSAFLALGTCYNGNTSFPRLKSRCCMVSSWLRSPR